MEQKSPESQPSPLPPKGPARKLMCERCGSIYLATSPGCPSCGTNKSALLDDGAEYTMKVTNDNDLFK